MTFAEKLKELRAGAGWSQEKLAEKLGLSRQAVTKWETDAGTPELENLIAVSGLFGVSIDELLSNEVVKTAPADFLYESVTEYDIDEPKHYDMKLGGAKTLFISGYEGEKIIVRLASNTIETLHSDFKVRIDDIKRRIDVDISRRNGMTEAEAKEALTVFVRIPNKYIKKIEAEINAGSVELRNLTCESIELDAKTKRLELDGVEGTVEVNCNLDMEVLCRTLNGSVEINQVSATSRIGVPRNADFSAAAKGIRTSISYEKNGKRAAPFCVPGSDNYIELNGVNSELIIYTIGNEVGRND